VRALAERGLTGGKDRSNQDFHGQLLDRRLFDAKYHLLERLKAHMWQLYETGIISGKTSSCMRKAVLDELDELDMGRHVTTNGVLPFGSLYNRFGKMPRMVRLVVHLEEQMLLRCGERALAFPLRHLSNSIQKHTFSKFEREYDMCIGYLLAHERVLEEHDTGTRFSSDHGVDQRLLSSISASIGDVTRRLALMRLTHPGACAAAATLKAARMVLNKGEELIRSMAQGGCLDEEEAERLTNLIRSQEISLRSQPPVTALPAGERSRLYHHAHAHSEETIRHEQARIRHSDEHRSLRRQSALDSKGRAPDTGCAGHARRPSFGSISSRPGGRVPLPLEVIADAAARVAEGAASAKRRASTALRSAGANGGAGGGGGGRTYAAAKAGTSPREARRRAEEIV